MNLSQTQRKQIAYAASFGGATLRDSQLEGDAKSLHYSALTTKGNAWRTTPLDFLANALREDKV